MIDFHFIKTKTINLPTHSNWLKNVILSEEKSLGEVAYIFCDDSFLLKKNIEFLKRDYLTDVITFDYSKKNKISGDIFISINRVKENSKKFNESFLTELERVMVHGLLHLLGYNDKTKKESLLMTKKENFYLSIK